MWRLKIVIILMINRRKYCFLQKKGTERDLSLMSNFQYIMFIHVFSSKICSLF